MPHVRGYVDAEYLKVAAAVTERVKQRSYILMGIRPGHKVLDVGCGTGTDTVPLAGLVYDQGQVVGIDYDEEMIAEADRSAADAGASHYVKHVQADATALPFESNEFDSSRSERLFQHLPHPEQALSEMVRVTKPGGWIVVLDADWGSASIDSPHVDIERRLMRVLTEHCHNNGYSGRQLYRLFRQHDLGDIVVEAFALPILSYPLARQLGQLENAEREAASAGIISSEELAIWSASLRQADEEGVFFASVSIVIVAGRTSDGRSTGETD